jgi:hypothetical protein
MKNLEQILQKMQMQELNLMTEEEMEWNVGYVWFMIENSTFLDLKDL